MNDTYLKRNALIVAALSHQASFLYDEDHPDNPHGDAEMELRTEMLDEAAKNYVAALTMETQ